MRAGSILIVITLLATGVAVWLHATKGELTERMLVMSGLKGIDTCLHPSQPLTLYAVGIPSEIFLYARYALAPRHLELAGDIHHVPDTLLFIKEAGLPDSTFTGKQIIWEHKEGHYHFQLLGR